MVKNMIKIDEFTGAIFDVDGTMLDSMWKWDEAEASFLSSFGVRPSDEEVELLHTYSLIEVAGYFQSKYGVKKSISEITDEKNEMMDKFYFEEVELKPGVTDVLEKLRGFGIKMCVATATDKYLIEAGLKRLGILEYFGKIFTCGEENTTKTRPDIYIRAAEFLGTEINKTLVFEDAVHAVKSAKEAGFPIVAVYDKSADAHQKYIKDAADYYYASMEEISFQSKL